MSESRQRDALDREQPTRITQDTSIPILPPILDQCRQSDAETPLVPLIILESRSISTGSNNEATLEGSTKYISILITTMRGNFVDRPVFVG